MNRNVLLRGEAPLNEFYEFLGLDKADYGEVIGWSSYNEACWVDFDHYMAVMDDGLECCIIEMIYEPTADYQELQ